MEAVLVLTLIGTDRPGLVGAVSSLIADNGGNWLESRMAHLAGKFAGVLRLSVPADRRVKLLAALAGLEAQGLKVVVEESQESAMAPDPRILHLELIGQDRPGIVQQISLLLSEHRVNVEELTTAVVSAPMSGEPMFQANARLAAPAEVTLESLRQALERIGNDLMVDVTLDEKPARPA